MPAKSGPHGGIDEQKLSEASTLKPEGNKQKKWAKRYRTEIAASSASILSTFAAFPLDSVKTRMQTYKYDSFTDCVRHTYRTEKWRGFFRGVTAPMASIALVRTVSFSVYQKSKYTYAAWFSRNFGFDPLLHVNTPGTYPTFSTIACFGAAGATAGSFITLVACPFELTKLSAQVSVLMADSTGASSVSDPLNGRAVAASYQNKGTFKTAKNIVKHRGIAGLYSGFNLHLLRDTLGTAIYFMTYESCKQLLTTFRGDSSPTNPVAVVLAGGLCGVASWALIYPIDSAKSIYQRNCLTHCRGEKVEKAPKIQFFNKRMYRGLGVSMGRSCVVNSIFFSAFEFIKKQINAMEDH
ncbi:related to CARNITINE/ACYLCARNITINE TRANSLOCASE [Phialocephala subalpina]|uniref:Related to CARNITINE/ACYLCARNITINE TRANSLOCASE n=1 Tax=Phialocephala subalpina TaxID=576137 RepID=A0A1L7WKJ1_9HELO|nr:related to CARNITINE/ACYLCARNITINE TRANSLOCASE [Phialocephala subalpina]